MGRCVSFPSPGSLIVCPNAIISYDAEAKLFFIRNRTAASLVKKNLIQKGTMPGYSSFKYLLKWVKIYRKEKKKKESLNVSCI